MMTDRFHCRLTWTEAVLEMMMYGFDDNDKTMASSTIIPTASTRPNSVRVLGSAHETESIPLTEYCRVFLGQRRGAKRLEDILKGSRRGGELKIDWTKPLPRA